MFVASAITTVLWIVATLLFRLYVQNFGSYNKTYGTIGGVIMLLTWMYYSMFVLLDRRRARGGDAPRHRCASIPTKGAIYHGRIVSESGPGTSVDGEGEARAARRA